MNFNWDTEAKHAVKREVNDFVFSQYDGKTVGLALSMPSTTAGCMMQCKKRHIFDENTMHIAIECGGFLHEGKIVNYEMFKDILSNRINDIFSTSKYFFEQFRLYWGVLGDGKTNIGMREQEGSIEWGNYDTCSFVYSIDNWLKYHLVAFKDDAPIIITFDADYENRQWGKNMDSVVFADTSKNRGIMRKWFNIDGITKSCHNDKLLDIVDEVKITGTANYLESIGIHVDFAGCYMEDVEDAKLMIIFSGRKKQKT